MTENIPGLIAEARKAQWAVYLAAPEPVAEDLHRIIKSLADALESRSAPSSDDREALYHVLLTNFFYADDDPAVMELTDAVLAVGFRRLSPVTREALIGVITENMPGREGVPKVQDAWLADAIMSALSLPEPEDLEGFRVLKEAPFIAVEFDGGVTFALTGGNAGHWVEGSPTHEPITYHEIEWAHAANGDEFMDWSDDPKGAVAYRTKAGVPVRGIEQWDDEKCTHEEFYLGRCVACGTADDREYDPDDMPTIRAASEMAGCQNRGWYHDGSEEAEAHAQKRPVRPCPHHDGRNR